MSPRRCGTRSSPPSPTRCKQVREDKAKIAEIVGKPTDPAREARAATYPTDLEPLIDALVREASGLEGRKHVSIDLVSPSIDPKDQQQCAGAFLFHFGGFFELAYRRNDFDLGFRNMRTWITDRLLATELKGVDPAPVQAALDAAYASAGWERPDDETIGPKLSGAGEGRAQGRAAGVRGPPGPRGRTRLTAPGSVGPGRSAAAADRRRRVEDGREAPPRRDGHRSGTGGLHGHPAVRPLAQAGPSGGDLPERAPVHPQVTRACAGRRQLERADAERGELGRPGQQAG